MRGLALGRWASKAPGLWTRGSGLRLAASATGFMAEVPAFTLSGRALRWLDSSGPNQAPTSFGQDLLGAGLTIGLLKGFSALGREAVSRSPNFGRLLPHAQRAVGQGAALAGLMTAHSVEDKLGMRPHADISTMAMDALASMVSLGIGAQLGRKALGKSYSAWNDELNARIRIAEQNPGIASKPVLWFRNPLYAPLWSAMAAGGLGAGPSPRPVHSVSPEHPFQGRQIAFSRAKFLENHEGLGNNGWARDSFQIPFAEIAKNDFVKSFWPESVEALSPRNDPLSQKKIRVLVASSSELKVASARKAFQRLWPDAEILVEGAKAHSEINEQPYGLEETFKGAFNRLRNSRKLKTVPYDYCVAFENGIVPIEESGERFLDLAAIVIEDPNGLRTRALSGGVEFPSEMVLLARQRGFEQNTAGSLIAERFGCDPKDPHLYLTGNAVSRESLLIQGIELGLAQTERFSSSGGKPPKGKTRRLAEFASATVGGAISWLASKWPGGGKKGPEPVSKGSPPDHLPEN